MRCTGWLVAAAVCLSELPRTEAFIEELFGQAFGGGGGGGFQQFHQQRPQAPKWPKGVPDKPSKKFGWLKGTEWNWNSWRNIKFEKDGTFDAPTQDCQNGMCKWSSSDKKEKVYILWGDAGLHELSIQGELPTKQDATAHKGLKMSGKNHGDGSRCDAVFQRVFDHEAAELDKDLYEILGLEDDAEETMIKKSYKKMSIKYHPDKNPGEEARKMFNEVRDAYEILSNPEKKILYDVGGMESVKKLEKGQVESGEDMKADLEVTLEELYSSVTKSAGLERRVVCRGCSKKPDSPKCRGCSRCPNEIQLVQRQMMGMIIQQQEEVASKEKCKQEDTVLDVQVEKGMKTGEHITFPHMAEQRPGMLPGSVVLTLKTTKHTKFERRGDDLHMDMQVTLRESLLGWTQTIRHLDGHKVEIGTTSVTKPMQVMKINGEGMPLRDDPASFGDLYVKVEVLFPKQVTDAQYESIEAVFKATPPREEL